MSPSLERLEKIRRLRLRQLIDEEAHGNTALFARQNGIGQSLLSRYVSDGAHAKPVGYIAARQMEERINATRQGDGREPLPAGFLDDPAGLELIAGSIAARLPETGSATPTSSAEEPPVTALLRSVEILAGHLPAQRCEIVANLIAQVLTGGNPQVYLTLLREELARYAPAGLK